MCVKPLGRPTLKNHVTGLAISRRARKFRNRERAKNNLTGITLGIRPIRAMNSYTLHTLYKISLSGLYFLKIP